MNLKSTFLNVITRGLHGKCAKQQEQLEMHEKAVRNIELHSTWSTDLYKLKHAIRTDIDHLKIGLQANRLKHVHKTR
jgi:hypothetical protein